MKKLLIHIGYGKTGTTTLQNAIFHTLGSDKIKYFGRSKSFNKNDKIVLINKSIMEKENIDFNIELSLKKLNVISNEDFLSPTFNLKPNYKDPYEYPEVIYNLFNKKEIDDIKILVVLRNQPELIYSNFVQLYNKLKHKYSSYEEFLYKNLQNTENKNFSVFYFYDILNKYSQVFGKDNIKIMFFEDLVKNTSYFCRELSDILEIDEKFIN